MNNYSYECFGIIKNIYCYSFGVDIGLYHYKTIVSAPGGPYPLVPLKPPPTQVFLDPQK